MNERERRDYDLARRLAYETGSEVDGPSLQRARRPLANGKHDLSKHSYAQLRDLINTSCGRLTHAATIDLYSIDSSFLF